MPRKSNIAADLNAEIATATEAPKRKRAPKAKPAPVTSNTVPALAAFLAVLDACYAAPPADMLAVLPPAPKRGDGLLTAHEKVASAQRLAPLLADLVPTEHQADVARWLADADANAKAGTADRDTLAILARVYGLAARLGLFRSLTEYPHHATALDASGAIVMPQGATDAIDAGGMLVALDKDGRDMRNGPEGATTWGGKGATFKHLGERLTDRAAAGDLPRAIARAIGAKVAPATTSEDTPAESEGEKE